MFGFEETITLWLTEMAHHPTQLYVAIILILFASSFGLPFPEEIVLITAGAAVYVARSESLKTGLPSTLNPEMVALVCFAAVFISDALVFFLGRRFGISLLNKRPFSILLTPPRLKKVESWTSQYGALACGIFRFTPAIRFPGHFMCGALKIKWLTFIIVDGLAALLTVPSQVLLIAYYGDEILIYFKQFKITILVIAILLFVGWMIYKRVNRSTLQES
jgi:membrane protein DedA with SNARE-associated domain